jgi:hypothetical protein
MNNVEIRSGSIDRRRRAGSLLARMAAVAAVAAIVLAIGVGPASGDTASSFNVASSPVRQGSSVKFTGTVAKNASGKLLCDSVSIASTAFSTSAQSGSSPVVAVGTDGKFHTSVRLSGDVAIGSYTATATCASQALGTAQFEVVPVFPLDHTGHAEAQLVALLVVAGLFLLLFGFVWSKQLPAVHTHDGQEITRHATVLHGHDGRISTSKTIALMWTPVVAYIVATLAFIAVAKNDFGLWHILVGSPVGVYLVLLGGPFAGLVGAKSIVSTQVNSGRIQKPNAGIDNARPTDIFSNDTGDVDIVDTQYLFFNLVAIAVVLAQFVSKPGFGAPDIPWFLAALTGTSAATYLANKGLASNSPNITSVVPSQVRIGQTVVAYGTNLYAPAAPDAVTKVTVGGVQATSVTAGESQVQFAVPPPATGTAYPNTPQQVVITTVGGATAVWNDGITVVVDAPMPVRVDPPTVRVGNTITVFGSNLFDAAQLNYDGTATAAAAPQVVLKPIARGAADVACSRPAAPAASDRDSQVTVTVPATTAPGNYYLSVRNGANAAATVLVVTPSIVSVTPPAVPGGQPFVLTGTDIFLEADLDARGLPTAAADPGVALNLPGAGAPIPCGRSQPPAATDTNTQVTVVVPAGTAAAIYRVSMPNVDPAAPVVNLEVT